MSTGGEASEQKVGEQKKGQCAVVGLTDIPVHEGTLGVHLQREKKAQRERAK